MSALGVPLMGLAMASIAAMVITIGDPDEAKNTIAKKVTMEELKMMHKFDLDDGDGEISRAEFILLCSVRLGALSPDLIGMINERFKILDVSGDGNLSHAEILEDPQEFARVSMNLSKNTGTEEGSEGSVMLQSHTNPLFLTAALDAPKVRDWKADNL
ncbi:hypothetical protein B484DRAFT_402408 [Ochromonadaceae sp. CCMP2298]|nr:hypothetical protein B484DRAFT_402408 [Ochromonadaceae sp. CCMP2298]